jgi:2-C-methyl-D-erythritol 4-phosphate cytidylyltransferase
MGSVIPKQFLDIQGKAILLHTIDQFTAAFSDIELVIVLPAAYIEEGKNLLQKNGYTQHIQLVEGEKQDFNL